MRRRKLWRFTNALTFLLLCSAVSCASWTTKQSNEVPGDAVCRDPSAAERRALQTLVRDSLPSDGHGNVIDLAPGDPLPEGAIGPARPDLFEAASWATGMFCRCYPERCAASASPKD